MRLRRSTDSTPDPSFRRKPESILILLRNASAWPTQQQQHNGFRLSPE
ncbi:hypothetical protein GLE_1175 [Lysobacter enzymogenes]|uniref:Uncharacterized protein n=1 Tax=Lysobacter enzymogenes TaxID=69 RepID=A0A0S2DDF8_LYSEN|nr:hypothetical protein GLE_1175 [Lysobacter enzymogenes]